MSSAGSVASSRTRGPRLGYLPGLDGLRGLAVLAVIVYHADKSWLPGGFLGVEVFFVVSGYLITALLVAEREREGRVALGDFWLRRARRLLPALFVTLIGVGAYTALFVRDELGQLRGDVAAGLTYVTNWFQISTGTSYFSELDFVPLRHLWSLAVEEQFYLLWPLVMILVVALGRRRYGAVAVGFFIAAVAANVAMAVVYRPGPVGTTLETPGQYIEVFGRELARLDVAYLSTITRGGGLLLGAALAMVWQPWALRRAPVARHARAVDLVGLIGLAGLVLACVALSDVVVGEDGRRGNDVLFRGGFALVGLASVAVIAAMATPGTWLGSRLGLGNPVLSWVGTRSYGLYLYHWPIFQMSRRVAGLGLEPATFAVLCGITAALAELSYRFIERPIREGRLGPWLGSTFDALDARTLAVRRRLLVSAGSVAGVIAFTGVSLVTAEVRPNEIRESVEAGETATTDLLDSMSISASDPPATTFVTAGSSPGSTVPAEVPGTTLAPPVASTSTSTTTTTTLPPQVIDLVAIGDSVMLGAATQLQERGYVVDAVISRQFKAGVEIVTYLNQLRVLGSVVVVHLGTNGPTSTETLDAFFSQLSEVPFVVVLTTRVAKDWQDRNNELIRALPERWPNVRVLDWYALSEGQQDWFYDDQTHLRPAGARAYAELIAQTVGR
jgi:peptidoglycan/LPS O-acetylase OafA/YrhL